MSISFKFKVIPGDDGSKLGLASHPGQLPLSNDTAPCHTQISTWNQNWLFNIYDVLWSIDYLCSTHFYLPAVASRFCWVVVCSTPCQPTKNSVDGLWMDPWTAGQLHLIKESWVSRWKTSRCIWGREGINVHLGDSPKTHMVRAFSFEHQKTCHCRQTGTCCSPTILSLSRLWHALLRKHGCMKHLKRAKTIRANAHACPITRVSFLYI